MRRFFAGSVVVLGLALVAGTGASAPRTPAPVNAAARTTSLPAAPVLPASLRRGMPCRDFLRVVGSGGWRPVDPLAAGSCVAAGDCEISLSRPRASSTLRVEVGSAGGTAVVAAWRFTPAAPDPAGDAELMAGQAAPAATDKPY